MLSDLCPTRRTSWICALHNVRGSGALAQVYTKEAKSELAWVSKKPGFWTLGPHTPPSPGNRSSPTSVFCGFGAIAWVLPMLGCWIVLLTFRAYNKLWSGRKEAILKAVCGLLKHTWWAARWAALWGYKEHSATKTDGSLLAPSPVLSLEGHRRLPQKRLELISIAVKGNLDRLLGKHFHSLEINMEKNLKNIVKSSETCFPLFALIPVIMSHSPSDSNSCTFCSTTT